ncbi:MAG: QueT transporter family protein [Clostridia bacterium]|nr:QueT transporter family protein [Clostridia bacterium]
MKRNTQKKRILWICQGGLVAALYVVLTVLISSIGLASGAIQLRVSEALCILPIFMPAAIPGLTVGCLISNLITNGIWQDVVFGTLATLIGALGAYGCRYIRPDTLGAFLAPFPTVLANTLIVPFVLAYGYGMQDGILLLMSTVGIGEFLSAYCLGLLLWVSLRKYKDKLFM